MTQRYPKPALQAWLEADLPVPLDDALRWVRPCGPGREEWADDLAEGIERADYISDEKIDELLAHPEIVRWWRPIEALAARVRTPEQARRVFELATRGTTRESVLRVLLRNLDWQAAAPWLKRDALAALRRAVEDLDDYMGNKHKWTDYELIYGRPAG